MGQTTPTSQALTLQESEWALLTEKQQIIVRVLLQHQHFGVGGEYLKAKLGYAPSTRTRAHVAHIHRLRTKHPQLRFVIQHQEGAYWLRDIERR